eukprot:6196257-Pleurochrysis_carterae.AAC.2
MKDAIQGDEEKGWIQVCSEGMNVDRKRNSHSDMNKLTVTEEAMGRDVRRRSRGTKGEGLYRDVSRLSFCVPVGALFAMAPRRLARELAPCDEIHRRAKRVHSHARADHVRSRRRVRDV